MKTINLRKEELDRLADACCRVFEIDIDDFYSEDRRRKVADARKVYFHIIKNFYEINELEISQSVPFLRHRTTIMFAVDSADDLLKVDRFFEGKYSAVYEIFFKRTYAKGNDKIRKLIKQKNR
jgi:chromosomal replication initiation ATPase DnaA